MKSIILAEIFRFLISGSAYCVKLLILLFYTKSIDLNV